MNGRIGLIGAVTAALSIAFAADVTAGEPLATSALPRFEAAKVVHESAVSTIYTSGKPVMEAAEGVRALLAADGWLEFGKSRAVLKNDMAFASYKKGRHGLNVYVSLAPAQGGATTVAYSARPFANDLPFPKDAVDIEYDDSTPSLSCLTGMTGADAMAFFDAGLKALGWQAWLETEAGKTYSAKVKADPSRDGLKAYFVRDGQSPLAVTIRRANDAQMRVAIDTMPSATLAEMAGETKPAEAPAPVEAKPSVAVQAPTPAIKSDDAADNRSDEQKFFDMARDLIREAQKPVAKKPKEKLEDQPVTPLKIAPNYDTPLPLPEGATEIEIDAAEGDVEFRTTANVASVAAFYRDGLTTLGWKEKKSVINSATMVVLNFTKGGKDISMTLMRMGDETDVDADGSGLVDEAAAAALAEKEAEANAPPQLSDAELKVADAGGLPVPEPFSSKGTTKSAFLVEANATVAASVETLLIFYRRELGKLGWTEEPGAVVAATSATVSFSAADGPATLKLDRKDGMTSIVLRLRRKADAEKSGYLPKPGQAKIMFGNMEDVEASVTIGKQTIKLKPGEGSSKTPNGPAIDVTPGAHKITVKLKGRPAKTDEATFGAGEIWGVLVGPGGVLPLPMY